MTQPDVGPPKDAPNGTPRDAMTRAEDWNAGGSRSPGSLPDQMPSAADRDRLAAERPVPCPTSPATPTGGGPPLPAPAPAEGDAKS
jgi:hypothetical protein